MGVAPLIDIAPDLHRWTAPHPEWAPGAAPETPASWPQDVGCVLYRTRAAAVFIDPLINDSAPGLWDALDARVGRRRAMVATTVRWHARSRDAVIERYGAVDADADPRALPPEVKPIRLRSNDETMYWLPQPAALVVGDRLLGDERGGVRMCPESWMEYLPGNVGHAELRDSLRALLTLPVANVLVSHGEPVLGDGRAAIARALG